MSPNTDSVERHESMEIQWNGRGLRYRQTLAELVPTAGQMSADGRRERT